jgi:GNAT superfamily N-acetyltransferase
MKIFRPHPTISLVREQDLSALGGIYDASRVECKARAEPEVLQQRFPSVGELRAWLMGGFELYKAVLQGELVGGMRCSFPTGACLLDALAVAPSSRGQGVGRALLERGVTRAKRAGMSKVWLELVASIDGSTSLYMSVGFRESTRVPLGGTGEALLMELSV